MTVEAATSPITESTHFAPVPSREPRRLLLLCTNMGIGGGAEEQVLQLAYAFEARGWKTMIVSMLPPKVMPADFAQRGIELISLKMPRGLPDPRALYRFARLIRSFRPDVVHTHMVHANLLARAARVISPFPVLVCTLHNLTMAGVEHDYTKVFELAHRFSDGFADRTTTICHAASDYYIAGRSVPASKMMVIPNGIQCQKFAHNPDARRRLREEMNIDGDFVWLAVGRLELQKNYPVMLRAFATLKNQSSTLLICGEGTLREQLAALASELRIASRVRFLGLRKDIPDVMSAADAYAMSSDMEGLSLALLQATAAGLPTVATNVAGNPETIIEGVNGFLTPVGDAEAFAAAMEKLMSLTASERAEFSRAGLQRVQSLFQVEPVVDRWETLFEELLEAADRRPRRRAIAPRTVTA